MPCKHTNSTGFGRQHFDTPLRLDPGFRTPHPRSASSCLMFCIALCAGYALSKSHSAPGPRPADTLCWQPGALAARPNLSVSVCV